MKKKLLLLSFLFSIVLLGNAQEYFSSEYNNSGNDSLADGYIKVKYNNYQSPVKYIIVLGEVVYGTDDFFDITSDSIVEGDSVSNILIISDSSHIPGFYGGFKAYAIDSVIIWI